MTLGNRQPPLVSAGLVLWVMAPPPSPELAGKQPQPLLQPPGLLQPGLSATQIFSVLIGRGLVSGPLEKKYYTNLQLFSFDHYKNWRKTWRRQNEIVLNRAAPLTLGT